MYKCYFFNSPILLWSYFSTEYKQIQESSDWIHSTNHWAHTITKTCKMYFPFYNYFWSLLWMCVGEERSYQPCHGLFWDVLCNSVPLPQFHSSLWKMTVQLTLSDNPMLQFTNITVWVMTHITVKYVDPGQIPWI